MSEDTEAYTVAELTLTVIAITNAIGKICESIQYMNQRIEALEQRQKQQESNKWAKYRTIQ